MSTLSEEVKEEAILDCALIIRDCQKEMAYLKSRKNPLFFSELTQEAEERLKYFLQLKRWLRNGTEKK